MTLQVGIVGSDGVVIASDRQITIREAGDATLTLATKFCHRKSVACCWSGDQPAMYAANYIRDVNWDEIPDRESELRECGNRAWKLIYGSNTMKSQIQILRKVLVAFSDCTLWELEVFSYSTVVQIRDKVIAGDARTTIKHLLNNYMHDPPMEVNKLIVLASHAILMGHKENPAGIGGLEVAVLRKDEPVVFLSPDQEKELATNSAAIHAQVANLLSQSFDYRTFTPPSPSAVAQSNS